MSRVAVVVPTFRRSDGLHRLVQALEHQTLDRSSWELIIVDDGAGPPWSEDVDAIVASTTGPTRVIHLSSNAGPARARNVGWKSSQADLLAFTDDDCRPSPDWLAAGVQTMTECSRIGIVQGPTIRPPDSGDYPYTCFTVVREVLEPSPWFEGCNLFLRREALDAAGGFDESFGMHGEETTLGWSVLERGWERRWAPAAIVVHELADRPWSWHLKIHFLESRLVELAARHPGLRNSFWRPWAVKRENALFALAVAGVGSSILSSRARPWALLLVIPYFAWLYPPGRPPIGLQASAHQVSAHAASLLGKALAGARERIFLL